MKIFEMIITIITVVLSSTVIAAVINWQKGNKENQLHFITGERSRWRKEMKTCMEGFSTCGVEEMDRWLTKLKVNLNGYGCHSSGKYPDDIYLDFFRDEHIWKLIDELQSEIKKRNYSEERVREYREKIIHLVAALLKFDWERSKREVKTAHYTLFSFMFMVIYLVSVCYAVYDYLSGTSQDIKQKIAVCIIVSAIIIFAYFMMWLPNILQKIKSLGERKWYQHIMAPMKWWGIGLAIILCLYSGLRGLMDQATEMIVFSACIAFIISNFIPVYILSKKHKLYTNYDQAVTDILGLNIVTLCGKDANTLDNRFTKKLWNMGINYNVQTDITTFLGEEEFKKYVDRDMQKKRILCLKGYLKYWIQNSYKCLKGKDKTPVLEFIAQNPLYCKCFVRYNKDGIIKYGPIKKKTIKNWGI